MKLDVPDTPDHGLPCDGPRGTSPRHRDRRLQGLACHRVTDRLRTCVGGLLKHTRHRDDDDVDSRRDFKDLRTPRRDQLNAGLLNDDHRGAPTRCCPGGADEE